MKDLNNQHVCVKEVFFCQIMSVSGHKKEETFLKYIRLSLEEKADEMADAASDGLL